MIHEQLGLFEETSSRVSEGRAKPFFNNHLQKIAQEVPSNIYFGTSSWTFPGWANIVYQKKYKNQKVFLKESLLEYCQYPLFKTVGIDRSFYKPLDALTLEEYGQQIPEHFRCVMKVWNEITTAFFPNHTSYGAKAGKVNPNFLNRELFQKEIFEPLKQKFTKHVGVLVLEFPPSTRSLDPSIFFSKLASFLESVPKDFSLAVEIRDARLLNSKYCSILKETSTSHVFNYWSHMPSIAHQQEVLNGLNPKVYVARLVLPPGKNYNMLKKKFAPFDQIVEPQITMREDVFQLCQLASSQNKPAYVLVNNKAEGCSPKTIEALARRFSDD